MTQLVEFSFVFLLPLIVCSSIAFARGSLCFRKSDKFRTQQRRNTFSITAIRALHSDLATKPPEVSTAAAVATSAAGTSWF